MTIGPAEQKPSPLPWFKSSHRTWPEQVVGAAIFLLVSLAFEWLKRWLIQMDRTFDSQTVSPLPWTLYHLLVPFAMWSLWRRYSFTLLKIELSVYLCQLILGAGWAAAFFAFQEPLLALAA